MVFLQTRLVHRVSLCHKNVIWCTLLQIYYDSVDFNIIIIYRHFILVLYLDYHHQNNNNYYLITFIIDKLVIFLTISIIVAILDKATLKQ